MPCICQLQLEQLGLALTGMAGISVPALPSLGALFGAVNSAMSLSFAAQFSAALPAIPGLSLSAAGNLMVAANAVASINAAFGINLLTASGQAQFSMMLGALPTSLAAAGLSAPLVGAGAGAAAILSLGATAGLMLQIQGLTGLNLMAPSAAASLNAGFSAALSLPVSLPSLAGGADAATSMAMVLSAAATLGINLALPGGAAQLSAAISAMLSLQLPGLGLALPGLGQIVAMLSAMGAINAAFGINLAMPGAAASLAAMIPQLQALANLALSISLPAMPTMPALPLGMASSAAISAMASINFAPLLGLSLGGLTGGAMAASLALQAQIAFGINIAALAPCTVCPFG